MLKIKGMFCITVKIYTYDSNMFIFNFNFNFNCKGRKYIQEINLVIQQYQLCLRYVQGY